MTEKMQEQHGKPKRFPLGHELGARSPCLECGDKCPGLALHYWKKICKYCQCKQDDHGFPIEENDYVRMIGPLSEHSSQLPRRDINERTDPPTELNKLKPVTPGKEEVPNIPQGTSEDLKPKKVILCGYLFVAPGLDPENPASRSRKWQRRFFVIYETGELCYQLDDNPSTAPQGTVNMYTCTEVYNAKNSIGHDHSMGVVTPEGTLFIKAETHEEKNSWFIVLSEYPKMNQEEEKHRRRKKKKEEREAGSSSIPVRIDTSKEGVSTSSFDSKPTSTSLGRMSSFKENIQPPKESVHPPGRVSNLRHSDHLNFRRSRSLRENVRKSRESPDEDEDSPSHSDTASGEEKEKTSRAPPPVSRARVARRHTSPIKHVDYPRPNIAKLKQGDMKIPTKHQEYSTDEETETSEKDGVAESESTETLHRNNNNVYKSDPKDSSPYIPMRKNSSGDTGSGRSSRRSSTTEKSPTAALKHSEPDTAVLSDEEIANLDLTKRGRMRLSKLHGDGENQSPSKRTIEKRRHARERRTRHTMDGSIQLIPVLDSDKQLEENKENQRQKLKRSNSDPSLADSEDAVQRKEIAEIFPELYHLKSGWLNLMGEADDDWTKHWFVLKDNKLSYYKDSKDDLNNLEGSFDLAGSMEAIDFTIGRNYGFKIKMNTQDDLVLSAMTSVIRTKWVNALNKAIQTAKSDSRKSSIDEGSMTPRIENVSESIPVKKDEESLTQVDSNKIEIEEGETKMRAPSQRIRDRKSKKPSLKDGLSVRESRPSSESDVFHDAVQCLERKQPEGRSESPDPSVADTQTGDINEAWEEVVDALQARLQVVDGENAALKVKNSQLQEKLEAMKYPQENSAEVELLIQIEKLVKVRSKLEHDMEEQMMQLKQTRNAADLTEQRNQELKEQVASVLVELEHKRGDYDSLQLRFERLVADLKEMETERSTARTRRKEERDKTVNVIERLNSRIDDLEQESAEAKENVRQRAAEAVRLQERCEDLDRRLAPPQEELVIVEHEGTVDAAAPSVLAGASKDHIAVEDRGAGGEGGSRTEELETRLGAAGRENKSLMAQLQGANRSTQMLKEKLRAKEETASRENASKELEELRAEISEREDEIEELNRRLAPLEEGRAGAESKTERLAQELARGQQRVKEVEGMLTQEQRSRLRAEDSARVLEGERDSLSERLRLHESQVGDLGESSSQREGVSEKQAREMEELRNALKSAAEEKGQMEEERDRIQQEGEGLRKEIEAKEDVLDMIQGEMKRVRGEWTKYRREVEKLKLENEDLSSRLDAANTESRSLREKVEELERYRMGEEGTTDSARAPPLPGAVEQLREELVRERSSSDSALKTLEMEMISKQEEFKVVSDQAEDYQRQLQLLTDALKHKAEAVIKLQAELAKRDAALAASQQEREDAGKSERLEKEVRRLRGLLEQTQRDFDTLEISHRQLRDQETQSGADHAEEVKRMGERIQDLIVKLSAAEKKVLAATSKETKGSKHKACKAREAEAASKIEALESQLQATEKKLKLAAHKLLEATTREVELRKTYQAKCIEGSRYREQSCSTQRELILLRKKVSNVDDVLREHETLHQRSLSDVKESYAIKMCSMEETRRKEQKKDAEALATALEAVKRVYSEQLQQELHVIQAGSTKDVDSMLRRHKDVVTHMNKDWVIMSSKFSGICRENARLTAVIGGLQCTLQGVQDSVRATQETNRTRLDDLTAGLARLQPTASGERGPVEDERLRMLNITLKLREFELKCAQDELEALRTIQEAAREAQPDEEGEPEGAVGGSEHYLNSGLKVSAL